MSAACGRALTDVPHRVCQFHSLRDIGEDLYAVPQARLRDRLRQLKLQAWLKDQRNALTDWLRAHLEHPRLLAEVLLGKRAGALVCGLHLSPATRRRHAWAAIVPFVIRHSWRSTEEQTPCQANFGTMATSGEDLRSGALTRVTPS